MRIRSYAGAFARDRRIYRIDRWTIPVPGGLPLAASAWFATLALAMLALGQLPVVGRATSVVGWPAAVLVGPGALAAVLTRPTVDGRSVPSLAVAAARWHLDQVRRRIEQAFLRWRGQRSLDAPRGGAPDPAPASAAVTLLADAGGEVVS
jgi:hypothetical protein